MSSQGSRLTQIQKLEGVTVNLRDSSLTTSIAISFIEQLSIAMERMRYQQKQMHDMAQKKSDMFDDTQKLLTSSLGAGKVRAMFDERRQRITAGIDKSYLLDPIVVETKTSTTTTTKRSVAPATRPVRYDQKMTNYSKVIVPPLQNRLINHDVNGNKNFTIGDDPLERTIRAGDSTRNTKIGVARKLTPAVSSPSPLKNVTNQKTSPASPSRSTKSGNSVTSSTGSVRSTMSPKTLTGVQTRTAAAATPKTRQMTATKSTASSNQSSFDEDTGPVPEGLVRCGICKRNFAEDRIEKHQVICQKNKTKKRKIFDASKKRVQGTEAESYLRKSVTATRAPKPVTTTKANNWRSKHEDFIKTIRAAKEMQAHLAKGGKLSDLPPPPVSENPDYVQCPHCSRRFNEGAASRHIPLCKNMQHNKPKPKPPAKKRF